MAATLLPAIGSSSVATGTPAGSALPRIGGAHMHMHTSSVSQVDSPLLPSPTSVSFPQIPSPTHLHSVSTSSVAATLAMQSDARSAAIVGVVSPAFFRLVARLQLRFRRLKRRSQVKMQEKLQAQRQKEEQELAAKLAMGRPHRKVSSTGASFLALPAQQDAGGATDNVVVPPLPIANNPSPQRSSNSSTNQPGSRPLTPASQRSGTLTQRSPRLPNKAADLLFGSKKHEDKRADILGISTLQMGFIDAHPRANKALQSMGIAAPTGAKVAPTPAALPTDTVVVNGHAAEKDSDDDGDLLGRPVQRTHSASERALLAGEQAAAAEAQRLAELERLRAEKHEAARQKKDAATAAAISAGTHNPPKSMMSAKAQQLLLGGANKRADRRGSLGNDVGSGGDDDDDVPTALSPAGSPKHGESASSPLGPGGVRPPSAAAAVNTGSKVLDKLGVTKQQLAMFPNNQSRAFAKLGVDVPLLASSLTDQNAHHASHAAEDREAERQGLLAAERARLEAQALAHAPKHQSSTKVQALLLEGANKRDKLLDKLGMSAKEIKTFQGQPKAFQKLGMFDQPMSARATQAQEEVMKQQRGEFLQYQQQQQQQQQPHIQLPRRLGALPPRSPQPHGRLGGTAGYDQQPGFFQSGPTQGNQTLSTSKSAPTLPTPGLNNSNNAANAASNTRKVLPSLAGRPRGVTEAGGNSTGASTIGGGGGGGEVGGDSASKWGQMRTQVRNHSISEPAGSIAMAARPSNGMSYSASLKSLASTAPPVVSSAPENLARAYGAATVAAAHASRTHARTPSGSAGLFSVVMAAKKVRTAGGTSKTVHVLAAAPSVMHGAPVASIGNGKSVPASLGTGFALQGTSAPMVTSPHPATAAAKKEQRGSPSQQSRVAKRSTSSNRSSGGFVPGQLAAAVRTDSHSRSTGSLHPGDDQVAGAFRVKVSAPSPAPARRLLPKMEGGTRTPQNRSPSQSAASINRQSSTSGQQQTPQLSQASEEDEATYMPE